MSSIKIGRYEILGELGRGAMGIVLRAHDPVTNRLVLIRTFHSNSLAGEQGSAMRQRFYREAGAAVELQHPGIIPVFDIGEDSGAPFLVMELIEGRTLASMAEQGKQFPMDRICEIGQQIADALAYAHLKGIVHGAIRPGNILMTARDVYGTERPRIADFGLTQFAGLDLPSNGLLLRSAGFRSPEQFSGARLDGRTDFFSLGALLYWIATGTYPFRGETLQAISNSVVHDQPIPPSHLNSAVPAQLETTILRCLAKSPANRYSTGEELFTNLAMARMGSFPSGNPLRTPQPHPKTESRAVEAPGTGSPLRLFAGSVPAHLSIHSSPGGEMRLSLPELPDEAVLARLTEEAALEAQKASISEPFRVAPPNESLVTQAMDQSSMVAVAAETAPSDPSQELELAELLKQFAPAAGAITQTQPAAAPKPMTLTVASPAVEAPVELPKPRPVPPAAPLVAPAMPPPVQPSRTAKPAMPSEAVTSRTSADAGIPTSSAASDADVPSEFLVGHLRTFGERQTTWQQGSGRVTWMVAFALAIIAAIATGLFLHTRTIAKPDNAQGSRNAYQAITAAPSAQALQLPPSSTPGTAAQQSQGPKADTPSSTPKPVQVHSEMMDAQLSAPRLIPTEAKNGTEEAPAPPPGFGNGSPEALGGGGPVLSVFNSQAQPIIRTEAPKKPEPPKPVVVSGGVMAGYLLRKTTPIYPPIAKAAHISGTVTLAATITKAGTITGLRVIDGPTALRQSAMDAVLSWRYRPYLLNNQPVDVETTIQIIFNMS